MLEDFVAWPGNGEDGVGIDIRREGVRFSIDIGQLFVALWAVLL
jgi:hypothetical protein